MLSDSPNKQKPTKRRATGGRRGVMDKHRHYSDSQKIEAVTSYLMLGSLPLVASTLKISYGTLKLWKSSEWWKRVEEDIRIQEDLQLSKRMQGIINRSLDVVEDRLDNGDFIYDQKTGKLRRKPVALRDAQKALLDISDRRDVLINRHIANESITTDKVESTLAKLAEQFEAIAKKVNVATPPAIEVTDVIFGDDTQHAKEES